MAQTDLVQAFEARLKMYSLDGRARGILAEAWPVIEPTLDDAIAEIIVAVRVLPRIGEIVARNAELHKKLEAAHFRALESLYAAAPINQWFESKLEIPAPGVARIRFTVDGRYHHAAGAAHGVAVADVADQAALNAAIAEAALCDHLHQRSRSGAHLHRVRQLRSRCHADRASARPGPS